MFAREYENAPEPVIGDDVPESDCLVPAEYPTLVTVPVPPVVIETHCMPVTLTYTSARVPSFAQAGLVLKIGAVVVPVQFPYTVLAAAVVVPPRSDFRVVNGMACAGPGLMPVRPKTEKTNQKKKKTEQKNVIPSDVFARPCRLLPNTKPRKNGVPILLFLATAI